MKKIIVLLLALSMALTFVACGNQTNTPAGGIDSIPLDQMLSLFCDMTDLELGSFCQRQEITPETAGFAIGAEEFTGEFESAQALAPMMITNPFVLIVFRLAEGADAAAFATELKEKADPAKWICVVAEAVETRVSGRTVLFFMSPQNFVEPITKAFDEMTKEGFNPEDHIIDPFEDLTMTQLYDKLYPDYSAENYGFMDNADLGTLSASTGYGLSALDAGLFSDTLIDEGYAAATDELPEGSYALGMFRLKDAKNAASVVSTIKEKLDYSSLKGENVQGVIASSGDVVIVYVGAGSNDVSAYALESTLSMAYRMNVSYVVE